MRTALCNNNNEANSKSSRLNQPPLPNTHTLKLYRESINTARLCPMSHDGKTLSREYKHSTSLPHESRWRTLPQKYKHSMPLPHESQLKTKQYINPKQKSHNLAPIFVLGRLIKRTDTVNSSVIKLKSNERTHATKRQADNRNATPNYITEPSPLPPLGPSSSWPPSRGPRVSASTESPPSTSKSSTSSRLLFFLPSRTVFQPSCTSKDLRA